MEALSIRMGLNVLEQAIEGWQVILPLGGNIWCTKGKTSPPQKGKAISQDRADFNTNLLLI